MKLSEIPQPARKHAIEMIAEACEFPKFWEVAVFAWTDDGRQTALYPKSHEAEIPECFQGMNNVDVNDIEDYDQPEE